MAFTAKSLADGQLATAQGDLYAPVGVKGMISTMEFFNAGSNTETVSIFQLRSGGASRQIYRFVLAPNESATVNRSRSLSNGDKLRGFTTNAASVNYEITGAEE